MKSVPSFEKPLYESVQNTYQTLSALKNNRNAYISSAQVYRIYDQFLRDLHELSIVRKDEELKGITLALPNQVDLLVDDVWQLLSLSFITCGLTKFAPATYSSLSTVYKLLTHLKECRVYSAEDLGPISARLQEIESIVEKSNEAQEDDFEGSVDHRREETLLLRNKLAKCLRIYRELEATFQKIPADLEPVYLRLLSVRKSLFNYLTDNKGDKAKDDADAKQAMGERIGDIKKELRSIARNRDAAGTFVSGGSEEQTESAQVVLNGLLDDCHNLLNDLDIQQDNGISSQFETLCVEEQGEVVAAFKQLYTELLAIKQTLENLLVTRRWTLRETDLYTYQKALKDIDDRRMQLNRGAGSGRSMKKIQLLVLYLLRRNYASIYKLLESSEPVSESLQPIHNQLTTVRRCLLEIKRVDGLNNLRELFPFQFKLASLDNLRHDGKFIVNNQVPEGQGTLNALLAECFDIVYELKIELEAKEDGLSADDEEITDDEDKGSDDEVELKRNRYAGFNEADYDVVSESELSESDSEFESNDYY